jgi:hypothetical protein
MILVVFAVIAACVLYMRWKKEQGHHTHTKAHVAKCVEQLKQSKGLKKNKKAEDQWS